MDYNQAKKLMKLQEQAKDIQNELSTKRFSIKSSNVKVIINGQLKLIAVEFDDTYFIQHPDDIKKQIVSAVNDGMEQAQTYAKFRMSEVMSQFEVKHVL